MGSAGAHCGCHAVAGSPTVLSLGVGDGAVLLSEVKPQLTFVSEVQVAFFTLKRGVKIRKSHLESLYSGVMTLSKVGGMLCFFRLSQTKNNPQMKCGDIFGLGSKTLVLCHAASSRMADVLVLGPKIACHRICQKFGSSTNNQPAEMTRMLFILVTLCVVVHVSGGLRFDLHFHRAICRRQTTCRTQVWKIHVVRRSSP